MEVNMFGEKSSYTSCIRIRGKPIIPPLMTPARREECIRDRRKACAVEMQILRRKLRDKCMKDLAQLNEKTTSLFQTDFSLNNNNSIEWQLTFGAIDNSPRELCNSENTPQRSMITTQPGVLNLTSEIIDVTQYNEEGVKILDTSLKYFPPKLIRSNSYTLDSPSPILLAHLEKEAQKCADLSCSNKQADKNVENNPESPSRSPEKTKESIDDCQQKPQIENIIETDVTIEKISLSSVAKDALIFPTVDPDLLNIINLLPNDSAKSILDALEKQNEKQAMQFEEYKQLRDNLLSNRTCDTITPDERGTSLSISSSQTLSYSVSTDNTLTQIPMLPRSYPLQHDTIISTHNCNRNYSRIQKSQEEWAASVIGAAAKGYLVRRLFRTEKVQGLIETIKDALLCALQLETSEIPDEADVELHRRLIQQVSAACDTFHSIFCVYSIKEQMAIIASDRESIVEKAKRPHSTISRTSLVSTPRQLV